ncbi:outer membrane beta-barrel protein [Muricauda sp. HICW]|uniref:Outer membrane beta-barrel protein n=1 Tax=Flagellimonas chongwuensis TaxID=2697365 RepID=A0A850NEY3_9FLAO|nr:porin family protein [Allomuricauda chongwuensis]NVN16972.1 outer membrane beta-barrel protein [Allomuricauda chongwuensis]
MKKSVSVVVIVLLASSLFVNAQERNFGVLGGLNYANIRGDRTDFTNNSWRTAYHFGVFSNISLSDRIALEPRVLLSSKGYNNEIDLNEFDNPSQQPSTQTLIKYANRNNYLSLPILFKYKLMSNLSLDLGPEIAFLLYSKHVITKVDGEGYFAEGDVPQEGSGDFFLDYGAMAGITFYFTTNTSIQLNYFYGLSNLHRKAIIGDSTENNSVFQLSLGYLIF